MNTMLQSFLGSLIRFLLAAVFGYLVEKGAFTSGQAEIYITAGSAAIVSLGWSLWQKYKSRSKLLTALMMPEGSTENDLKKHLSSGLPAPTVLTPPNTPPGVPDAGMPLPYDPSLVKPIHPGDPRQL